MENADSALEAFWTKEISMSESKDSETAAGEGQKVTIDIPENAQLWVALEQDGGYAPTMIIGGNPQGLRMLSNYCNALAESGVPKGRMELTAGDPLLEGSECDLLLTLQSEDIVD
jgi:hypothetical protein